ncbi:MEDS domain-containing protein [Streptomyces sp. NPDC046909]|uniref:MEDS domain-containing protein n=1 Tax=Streptomyces sp. NPDC046909 TaxID=3155617 RepID=UPI00340C9591
MTRTPAGHHVGIHSGDEEFLAVLVPFLREGIAAEDEPDPLAVVPARKLVLLRDALGSDARRVDLRESTRWYSGTPANGLAVALDYYAGHAGPTGRIHMAGEPVWDGRSARQTAEWTRYEALVTDLFAPYPITAMCLYDTRTAPPAVIDAARRTHPTELDRHGVHTGPEFTDPAVYVTQDLSPLPAPPPEALALGLAGDMTAAHRFATQQARSLGMAPEPADRFGEAVSGATGYAAAQGLDSAHLLLWSVRERILCEVRAPRGRITDPFLGFRPPGPEPRPEDGLWRTRQICEFVDLRSEDAAEGGWTIRMETALTATG